MPTPAWRQHVLGLLRVRGRWRRSSRGRCRCTWATHLTGTPAGDTGVYVWNLWVFSHEIFATGTTPLSTLEILPLAGGPTDLSLHNYTRLRGPAGPAAARPGSASSGRSTSIYLFNAALAGFGMYPARAAADAARGAESFLAGLMFAWSPFLVTRGDGHFSLAAAAPLPIFMLMLYRAWDSQRLRDALLAGASWRGRRSAIRTTPCTA